MENKPTLISKGRYELKYRGDQCLNCGHPLDVSDKYCPNCSQANSTKKLVLKDFVDEFFSSLVNYDSKLLKTLYALLVKPGTITKDYIEGKRISYTNPFRFLLSLAFIYLLMFGYNNNFSNLDRTVKGFDGKINQSGPISFDLESGSINTDSTVIREETEKVLKKLDSLGEGNSNLTDQLQVLDSLGVFSSKKEIDEDSLILANPRAFYDSINLKESASNRFINKIDFFATLIKDDSIVNLSEANTRYQIPESRGNKMAFNAANSLLRVVAQPGNFVNATISKMPFVIFLFLPIFTVFIWLVYIRKKYTYTDHLIFSFHNQSLLFILLILSLIIDAIFDGASSGIFLTIFGFYLYKAMRKFYGQGRFKTIVKYLFLNTIFALLAFFTVVLLFTGSAFTY
ncbi:DUF3667 domain-containing protein [Flagellimonas allohymeniacidonis]|uniref:DUF3667 domain-containing protein n=1 Tax=Flagellimonas allohymeniacidonis TaxID=2517819 RepID=A0A4Q8QE99_9FLAO|nr:DUF3667 domain-containing protein [Allomuricauda hymeniacidonis]TAI46813.1 DUF3667 domain-containing protein [Allomuricauda hymeniacidonis]